LVVAQHRGAGIPDGESLERAAARAPVEVVARRRPLVEERVRGVRLEHAHQPLRLRIRQRPEQHGFDDAGHRGVCADAEAEREHGNGHEARVAAEPAQCGPHFLTALCNARKLPSGSLNSAIQISLPPKLPTGCGSPTNLTPLATSAWCVALMSATSK